MDSSQKRKFIIYTFLGVLYGLLQWVQSIIQVSIKNNIPDNNLIGLKYNIGTSQIKGLLISCFMSILYTIKDIYIYS